MHAPISLRAHVAMLALAQVHWVNAGNTRALKAWMVGLIDGGATSSYVAAEVNLEVACVPSGC